ncbi:uncharacterized protein Dwil_GK18541 [Drosophila willistoni]|uniref:Uncharacterized protein n=1 Tax=Drosophila willistoni TaxID=7260 RepID=B4NPS6_DROWI|nr:uncharacterized protein LOC6652863 [Drosophila willistoni]EDW86516.1 uncharacterized protein Dwil_GK18541 [Drosophila willistoni]
MSYQIRSTPYFRRMFNNSKKNGQLQRLREEYERIQEFNDRTIELKMRQVRLKRLFREIEDIKETAMTSTSPSGSGSSNGCGASSNSSTGRIQLRNATRRRLQHLTVGGPNLERKKYNQRLEALARAKELGQEISRRNAELAETGAGSFLRTELRMTAKMQAVADARREVVERRERAAKRISYGNAQSKHNIQRQVLRRQRRLTGGLFSEGLGGNSAVVEQGDRASSSSQMAVPSINSSCTQQQRAKLLRRLNYGNLNSLHGVQPLSHSMPTSPIIVSDSEGEQDLRQMSRRASSTPMEYHKLTIPNLAILDDGSDTEMHTAPLAPSTECTETASNQDSRALCCTEPRVLRRQEENSFVSNMNEDGIHLSTTIAAYQPPLAVPPRTDHEDCVGMTQPRPTSSRASALWRQISLNLSTLARFQNHRSVSCNGLSDTITASQPARRMGIIGPNPVGFSTSSYEDFSHDNVFWQADSPQRAHREFILPSEQRPTEQTDQSYSQMPQGYDLAQLRRAVFDQ